MKDQTKGAAAVERFRARLAKIVEVGASEDLVSRGYDFWITFVIMLNLTVAILSTYQDVYARHAALLDAMEELTVVFFALDYLLRLVAAKYIKRKEGELRSLGAYVLSWSGVIDLLSFLPHYLPVFFPEGAVAFRIFRIIRIFRLFRINAYYDSLNAITEVLKKKRQQLVSSVLIVLVLMLSASLCLYSVEHTAQPEVFSNAFSGIWWAASTLLTIGYGDIYPVTTLGKALSIVIAFLGVGMVAIPTGIISAGFVEQYGQMVNSDRLSRELEVCFIKLKLGEKDAWVGQPIRALDLPRGLRITAVHRDNDVLIPAAELVLCAQDTLILAAEAFSGDRPITLKELTLLRDHPWNGQYIRDLDLSRQTLIVMVKRGDSVILPRGDTRLRTGDVLLLHTKGKLAHEAEVKI